MREIARHTIISHFPEIPSLPSLSNPTDSHQINLYQQDLVAESRQILMNYANSTFVLEPLYGCRRDIY